MRDIPISPSYKLTSSNRSAGPSRPTPEVEKIDMISVYTIDADGEDDDEDVIIVEGMVVSDLSYSFRLPLNMHIAPRRIPRQRNRQM